MRIYQCICETSQDSFIVPVRGINFISDLGSKLGCTGVAMIKAMRQCMDGSGFDPIGLSAGRGRGLSPQE